MSLQGASSTADTVGGSGTARGLSSSVPLASCGLSGDRHARHLTSSGTTATGTEDRATVAIHKPVPEKESHPGSAAKIKLALQSCNDAVDRALESYEDLVERGNAINDLKDALNQLWKWRGTREEQFGDLVNHLETLLLDVEPEKMTRQKVEAFRGVIHSICALSHLTDPDLRNIESRLAKAGFEISRGLY